MFEYQRSNLEQAASKSPVPSFSLDGGWGGWAGVCQTLDQQQIKAHSLRLTQDKAPSFSDRAFPSGGGGHQGHFQIIGEPVRVVPRSLNTNHHGRVSKDIFRKSITPQGKSRIPTLQWVALPLPLGGPSGGRGGTAMNPMRTLDLAIDEPRHLALQRLLNRTRGNPIYPLALHTLTLVASVMRE